MQSGNLNETKYCVCCGGDLPLRFEKEIQDGQCQSCGWKFQYRLNEDGVCCFVVDQDFVTEFGLTAFFGG